MLARADGFFQGGFGNLVYLLLFFSTLPLVVSLSDIHPAFEPSGINLLQESMGEAAKAAFPDYGGGFVLGSTDIPIRGVFTWSGVDWTTDIILKPLVFFGIAVCLMLVSSILFDRFDPASGRPGRTKTPAALPTNDAVTKVEIVRAYILPITWIWPILILSGLGNREIRHHTQQIVFTSASPLRRQLPAAWPGLSSVSCVSNSPPGLLP